MDLAPIPFLILESPGRPFLDLEHPAPENAEFGLHLVLNDRNASHDRDDRRNTGDDPDKGQG